MKLTFPKIFKSKESVISNNNDINSERPQDGSLKITALFRICKPNRSKRTVDYVSNDEMGTVIIQVLPMDGNPEIKWKAMKAIGSELLPNYLKKIGVERFVPYGKPTFVLKNNTMEICFYHDEELYDTIFANFNSGYVNQINDPFLLNELATLCKLYCLPDFY